MNLRQKFGVAVVTAGMGASAGLSAYDLSEQAAAFKSAFNCVEELAFNTAAQCDPFAAIADAHRAGETRRDLAFGLAAGSLVAGGALMYRRRPGAPGA